MKIVYTREEVIEILKNAAMSDCPTMGANKKVVIVSTYNLPYEITVEEREKEKEEEDGE